MSRSALVLVIAVAACGPATVSLDHYQARIDEEECAWLVRCGVAVSPARCRTLSSVTDAFAPRATPSVIGAVGAGLIGYDEVQAAECIDQIAALSCSPVAQDVRLQPTSSICRGVFRADRRIGGNCYLDEECQSRRCAPSSECQADECCLGTCGEPVHLARAGDECSSDPHFGVACAPDAWCAGNICYPLLPRGASCYDRFACAWGLECFESCKPALAEGDRCEMLFGVPTCGAAFDLECDVPRMTCRRLDLHVGDACDPASPFCIDGYCDGETRVCHARPRVGEPCTFSTCEDGAYCLPTGEGQSLCVPLIDNGSPCFGFSAACQSGLCSHDDHICVDPPICI